MPSLRTPHVDWTREHLLPTLHLYTQLPFGKLDARNAQVKRLAVWLGRTANSVAMKLTNLSSLDPVIAARGLKGLNKTSVLDRAVWAEFHSNWDAMSTLAAQAYKRLADLHGEPLQDTSVEIPDTFELGTTRATTVQARVNQWRFRQSILTNYRARCCISGLVNPQLVIASHIVPWSADHKNRLNPQNGLCLSALHDRAFDLGLITVMPDLRVRVSAALRSQAPDAFTKQALLRFDNQKILLPDRYGPNPEFLEIHARRFGFKT